MLKFLRSIWRNEKGIAATEFALMSPVLLVLFAGSVEITFKIWSTQKAEKLAVTLADVVAQSTTVSLADLDSLTGTIDKIMEPFAFGANGIIFISSVNVAEDDTIAKVNWQYKKDGGTLEAVSKLGAPGDNAVLPEGFDLAPRDNIIVAEVYYQYEPILPGLLFGPNALIPSLLGMDSRSNDGTSIVYRSAIFKPRLGALTDPPA